MQRQFEQGKFRRISIKVLCATVVWYDGRLSDGIKGLVHFQIP